jgi:hypothetical protein
VIAEVVLDGQGLEQLHRGLAAHLTNDFLSLANQIVAKTGGTNENQEAIQKMNNSPIIEAQKKQYSELCSAITFNLSYKPRK